MECPSFSSEILLDLITFNHLLHLFLKPKINNFCWTWLVFGFNLQSSWSWSQIQASLRYSMSWQWSGMDWSTVGSSVAGTMNWESGQDRLMSIGWLEPMERPSEQHDPRQRCELMELRQHGERMIQHKARPMEWLSLQHKRLMQLRFRRLRTIIT